MHCFGDVKNAAKAVEPEPKQFQMTGGGAKIF